MTGKQAVQLAAGYIGRGPSTFYDYYSKHFSSFHVGNWCACFVSCIVRMAGATCAGLPGVYCPSMRNEGIKAGKAVSVANARPGDIVYFNWDGNQRADHVGMCEYVSAGNMTITTIDGNVSNRVGRRTRRWGEVMSVIRPSYAAGIVEKAKLLVDGVRGKLTVSRLQEALRDKGVYSAHVDGVFGVKTATALQAYLAKLGYYTRAVDGDFGYYSVVALQNWLRHLGYYTTAYLIDGDWGKVTTKCLQQALNAGKF